MSSSPQHYVQIEQLIEKEIDSKDLKSIVSKIQKISDTGEEIKKQNDTIAGIKQKIWEVKNRLEEDLKVKIYDHLKQQLEDELNNLERNFLSLESNKKKDELNKLRTNYLKLKEETNIKILNLLKKNKIKDSITYDKFHEFYDYVIRKIEIQSYRERIQSKTTLLNRIPKWGYFNIVVRVLRADKKEWYSPESNRRIKLAKYLVEDETKQLNLLMWDDLIIHLIPSRIYEITNSVFKEYGGEMQIKITNQSEIKEI